MREELATVGDLLAKAAGSPVWTMGAPDLIDSLQALQALAGQVASIQLAVVRELDGRRVPIEQGATSTTAWLRDTLRVSGRAAGQAVALARSLDSHPETAAALAAGALNTEQANVITAALDALPAEAGPRAVANAQSALLDFARDFEPRTLERLASRILAHVAPEIAEQVEAKALQQAEKRAHDSRTLTLVPMEPSRVRLTGWLGLEAAAIVNAALDPLTNPARRTPVGDDDDARLDDRTPGQRRADALVEVCQLVLRVGDLPDNGGDRPQLAITIGHDGLVAATGAGMLDSGQSLTPQTVRRVACDAEIIPAVLGGQGQILDVGRARRLFTGPLRRAIVLRDIGCTFPGCDRPARWCDCHHRVSWVDGGPTNLDNGLLCCHFHHRVAHHSGWEIQFGSDGHVEWIPPAYVDPERRPRRNHYWRRP